MPGFSLLFDVKGTADQAAARFAAALERMCHDERYTAHLAYKSSSSLIGWTGYSGYPVRVRESGDALLLIEGHVYDQTDHHLESLIAGRPDDQSCVKVADRLRELVTAADGDFACVYVRKAPPYGVVIAVDSLGRLPAYWHQTGSRLLISREVKFITALADSVAPDRRGIAETLILRCPLEDRTLLEHVSRMPAGGILCWEPEHQSAPSIERHRWCFDEAQGRDRNPRTLAETLTDQFRDVCRRRYERHRGHRIFLSLSGGLDSRAVAAGLAAAGADAATRTFQIESQTNPQEAIQAQAVAQACGLAWQDVRVSMPSPDAVDRLIHLKDGLNSGEMAYAEEYLSALIADGGEGGTFFTGEGGDVVLVARHPLRPISTCRELSELLLERSAVLPPPTVAALTGFSEAELRDQLTSVLEEYPEERVCDRLLHHTMMVSMFKEYYEGEDRNRAWLWPVAPFYARPFFDRAMTAPVAWKRRRRLQSLFLHRLSPPVASILNANTGHAPGTWADRLRQAARELILSRPALERLRRHFRHPAFTLDYPPEPLPMRLVLMAEHSQPAAEVFDRKHLSDICRGPLNPAQMWLLYTILRYLDHLYRPREAAAWKEGGF